MGFVLQDGCSPLHIASQKGYLDVMKTLMEAGANINHSSKVSTHICNTFLHMYDIIACDQCIIEYMWLKPHSMCVKEMVDDSSNSIFELSL